MSDELKLPPGKVLIDASLISVGGKRPIKQEREVYAVQAITLGLVKIGVTDDAIGRLRALRNFSPDRLKLLGLAKCSRFGKLEKELHERFAAQRAHGEWFNPSDEMLWFLQDTMDWNTRRVRLCQRELDQPDFERRLRRYDRKEKHLRRWI